MPRKIAVRLGTAVGIVAVLAGAGWMFLEWVESDMCGNEVIEVVRSPDAKWDAVLFERSCGPTTGFSSQISLLEAGRGLRNRSGNIYVADGYPNDYTLQWVSNDLLEVSGGSGRRFKAETEYSGISVSYR